MRIFSLFIVAAALAIGGCENTTGVNSGASSTPTKSATPAPANDKTPDAGATPPAAPPSALMPGGAAPGTPGTGAPR